MLNISSKDPRGDSLIKTERKIAENEWKNNPALQTKFSKKEYVDAVDSLKGRKAADKLLDLLSYDGWILKFFIDSYNEIDEYGFHKTVPECIKALNNSRRKREDLVKEVVLWKTQVNKRHFGNKPEKALAEAEKELALYDLKQEDWISISEYAEVLLASDAESWVNKYTPKYLQSMAIFYKLLEIRGVPMTPEEEEKIKYEILEKEVLGLISFCKYKEKPEFEFKFGEIPTRWRENKVFPDIAEIFIGISNRIDSIDKDDVTEEHYGNRKSLFRIIIESMRGILSLKVAYSKKVWNFFKDEDMRVLLFLSNNPKNLYDAFRKEFEEHNIKFEDITYDNVMKDEKWKNYVFQGFQLTVFGGKGSPKLINPPLMMESLIDRAKGLKEHLDIFEQTYTEEELDKDNRYLHIKWEYYAAKLQILLMDAHRATAVKKYQELSDEEKKKYPLKYLESHWDAQLGKYSNIWLNKNYDLANTYIETVEDKYEFERKEEVEVEDSWRPRTMPVVYKIDCTRYGGWYSSDEAYEKKKEIAEEMQKINQKLAKLNDHSPEYYDSYAFKCQDAYIPISRDVSEEYQEKKKNEQYYRQCLKNKYKEGGLEGYKNYVNGEIGSVYSHEFKGEQTTYRITDPRFEKYFMDVYSAPDEVKQEIRIRPYDFTISLLRDNDIDYGKYNNYATYDFEKSIHLEQTAYKVGIIRFDKEYLKKQKEAIASAEAKCNKTQNNALNEKFLSSYEGKSIQSKLDELLNSGISPEFLKQLVDAKADTKPEERE